MRRASLLFLGILLSALVACGQEDPPGFQEVETFEELEAVLEAEYEEIVPDTVDLLPGRSEYALGDLSEIQSRGLIRVLVSPSRTNYFVDQGVERGFEYEMMQDYWESLNRRTRGRFVVAFLPVSFDRLLPELVAGRGDIAAAGMTITSARQDSVSFTRPYLTNIAEIVAGRKDGPTINTVDDLAGQTVTVVRGSSYEHHLLELNETLAERGLDRIRVERAPQYVEAEDLLELVDQGLVKLTVVDEHIGDLWAGVLPNVILYKEAPIREGGDIAWAVRKQDTKLLGDLNEFVGSYRKGSLMGNILFNRYYDDTKWLSGPREEDAEKIAEMRTLVQKHAEEYGFDWLLLAALAYQESKLDQSARSRAGAVGLFQIKPAIAAADPIGVDNVHQLENNINAGIKYLAHIRDHYLAEPELSDIARRDLMLASYNAGPTRIRKLRRQAASKGLDPNVWFGNVERMAGRETIRYVANVNRFFYAYRLALHVQEGKEEAMSGAAGSSGN
jgi:membrane-bound lytic murein transglycosylase MltF